MMNCNFLCVVSLCIHIHSILVHRWKQNKESHNHKWRLDNINKSICTPQHNSLYSLQFFHTLSSAQQWPIILRVLFLILHFDGLVSVTLQGGNQINDSCNQNNQTSNDVNGIDTNIHIKHAWQHWSQDSHIGWDRDYKVVHLTRFIIKHNQFYTKL